MNQAPSTEAREDGPLLGNAPLSSNQTAALFGASLALVGVASVVLFITLLRLFSEAQSYEAGLELIDKVDEVAVILVDAEAGQRGYVITGDFDFLEPYYEAVGAIEQRLTDLHEIATDDPTQLRQFEQLQSLVGQKLSEMEAVIKARNEDGFETARSLVDESDRVLMEQIRAAINAIDISEALEIERSRETVENTRNTALWAATLLATIAVAMLAIAFIMVRKDQGLREHAGEVLEDEVKRRTKELNKANLKLNNEIEVRREAEEQIRIYSQELERSNRELNDFAFVASHDLQEPLRKIRAFGDRLKNDFEDQLGEQGADYLARMQSAAARMSALINDLLEFSRVNTRGRPFEQVDLSEVVQGVREDLEIAVRECGATIDVEHLPTIYADPMQMRQLFQNLIGNALKFRRPDAAPRIKVSKSETIIDGEPGWEISVEDNGIGFDEKYLDKIFTPFQRLHGREQYSGTGIGLAICRRIAERHGGTLTGASKPGEGARFTVTLPVAQGIEEEKQS